MLKVVHSRSQTCTLMREGDYVIRVQITNAVVSGPIFRDSSLWLRCESSSRLIARMARSGCAGYTPNANLDLLEVHSLRHCSRDAPGNTLDSEGSLSVVRSVSGTSIQSFPGPAARAGARIHSPGPG